MTRLRILRLLFPALLAAPCLLYSQPLHRNVLFLGNSYTYVNNLPLLTAALAQGSGDSLIFASHAPGGYTLGWQPIAHASDTVSLSLIRQANWDFVVLQEQSQTPAIPRLRDSCMLPASVRLHDSVKAFNPCTRVLFYLTWGRRFGGIQCFAPNYCSPNFSGFSQMQDSLTCSYKMVADSLSGWIAPAGEAWRWVIDQTGMVLHDGDNSHPNMNGSYLAACVFYDVIFGKPSAGIPFTAGLSPDSALILQQAADSITFGFSGLWNLNNDMPKAAFTVLVSGDTLFTHNQCTGAGHWTWDFGDGQTSALFEPVHVYASPGEYTVKMTACNDCFCDSASTRVAVGTVTTGRQYNPPGIRMSGPDNRGNVYFPGYSGNGILTLYDLAGRRTAQAAVSCGRCRVEPIRVSVGIWELSAEEGTLLSRGKFIIPGPEE